MKAFELLSDSTKFARGNYALLRNSMFFTNPVENPETKICLAEKWDICGALQHCYPYKKAMLILNEIEKTVLEMVNPDGSRIYNGWVSFNDNAPFNKIKEIIQFAEDKFNI